MAKYLKFSLRTFLLVVFLLCASLALYPRETIEKYRRQADAVQLLESTGFKLERRIPENKYYSHLLKMFVPEGDLGQVVTANGRSSGIRDNDLHSLKDLPWLEKLYLANNNITDEGLVHLTDCHGLKRVSLWFTRITDDGLSVFSDKQELEVLDISEPTMSTGSTDVTRACLKHFEGLPRLKILKFSFPIEDDDLFLLATLPRFAPESLTVNSASNSGIFELTRWRSLKGLKLNGGSYLSLIPLQRLPNLRSLSITGSGIDDQQLAGAMELSQIEGLSLYQSSASNWIVPKLMELPNLKRLDVRNTKVNCDVVPDLAKVKSKCELSTSFPFDAFALRRAEGRMFSYRWNHQCYLSADDLPAVEEFQCNGLEMVDLSEVELDSLPNGIDFQANPKPFSNESVSKVLAKAKCQWIGIESSNVNLDCLRELDQSMDSTVRQIRFNKEMRLGQAVSQPLA